MFKMKKNKIVIISVIILAVLIVSFTILIKKGENIEQKNYNCEFTKTYMVYGIYESNNQEYLYITIREFQDEDIQTIKIEKKMNDNLEVGCSYEFKLKQENKIEENSILSIFSNSKILSITKTEKTGFEQTQESPCN